MVLKYKCPVNNETKNLQHTVEKIMKRYARIKEAK